MRSFRRKRIRHHHRIGIGITAYQMITTVPFLMFNSFMIIFIFKANELYVKKSFLLTLLNAKRISVRKIELNH
jgi:hypothetical protein